VKRKQETERNGLPGGVKFLFADDPRSRPDHILRMRFTQPIDLRTRSVFFGSPVDILSRSNCRFRGIVRASIAPGEQT
jgi:hypothetical protein